MQGVRENRELFSRFQYYFAPDSICARPMSWGLRVRMRAINGCTLNIEVN
jgi:hypothetical protein